RGATFRSNGGHNGAVRAVARSGLEFHRLGDPARSGNRVCHGLGKKPSIATRRAQLGSNLRLLPCHPGILPRCGSGLGARLYRHVVRTGRHRFRWRPRGRSGWPADRCRLSCALGLALAGSAINLTPRGATAATHGWPVHARRLCGDRAVAADAAKSSGQPVHLFPILIMWRLALQKAAILLAGVAAATLMVELGFLIILATPLRWVLPLPAAAIYGPDADTGFRHRANVSGLWLTDDWAFIRTSN